MRCRAAQVVSDNDGLSHAAAAQGFNLNLLERRIRLQHDSNPVANGVDALAVVALQGCRGCASPATSGTPHRSALPESSVIFCRFLETFDAVRSRPLIPAWNEWAVITSQSPTGSRVMLHFVSQFCIPAIQTPNVQGTRPRIELLSKPPGYSQLHGLLTA